MAKKPKKSCAGLKRNGRLKKGFRWKKKGACPSPAKKGAAKAPKKKKGRGRGRVRGSAALSISKTKRSLKLRVRCAGLRKSGARKGTLKRGFKWKRGFMCPVKQASC